MILLILESTWLNICLKELFLNSQRYQQNTSQIYVLIRVVEIHLKTATKNIKNAWSRLFGWICTINNAEYDLKRIKFVFVFKLLIWKNNQKWYFMVRGWVSLEVGSAPPSNLVGSVCKTCSRKMGQTGLRTRRWGTKIHSQTM